MVAGLDRRHIGADGLDYPGPLMAEHDRPVEREPPDPVDHVQIAVADPGRHGAHQDLAPPWLVDLDLLDRQPLAHFAKHRGLDLHDAPP